MDKNFFIAILLSLVIIILYSSPQYQKRFGRGLPISPKTETTAGDSLQTTDSRRPTAPTAPIVTNKREETVTSPDETPEAETETAEKTPLQINIPETENPVILENSDVKVTISPRGAAITGVILTKFNGVNEDERVYMVKEGESWYDGYIVDGDFALALDRLVFSSQSENGRKAVLTAELSGNMSITREFTLDDSGYLIQTSTRLTGAWDDPVLHTSWHGPINETEIPYKALRIWPFSMMMRDDRYAYQKLVYLGDGNRKTIVNGDEKTKSGGKRIFPKEDHGQKIDARKSGSGEDTFDGDLDWYAVRNKYFISVAIPDDKMHWSAHSTYSSTGKEKWFDFTLTKRISDGSADLDIYTGPISYDILKGYGRDLTEAMELSFRFIRPISILFLWLFKKLHTFISNWGIVIILFSLIIKVVLYPLSKTSYDSMRRMSSLQPQINLLKEKYKNNPQMLQKATMELYKKEGVNPFSSCLPTLLQLPVFLALYPVVGRAFELRQAMFIPHWIEDLSRPDPFYILPIAMGISMFFQSKTTMKDPNQKPMLYIMPVMMVILFANFSSGLTLYWFLFNITSYLQQTIHRS